MLTVLAVRAFVTVWLYDFVTLWLCDLAIVWNCDCVIVWLSLWRCGGVKGPTTTEIVEIFSLRTKAVPVGGGDTLLWWASRHHSHHTSTSIHSKEPVTKLSMLILLILIVGWSVLWVCCVLYQGSISLSEVSRRDNQVSLCSLYWSPETVFSSQIEEENNL